MENQINADTRRIIQLFKDDPAKMKMLQKKFPSSLEVGLEQYSRNLGNNPNYKKLNPLTSMNLEDANKVRDLERIQVINANGNSDVGFYPSESQRNLNAVTGILSNDQENFIGYPDIGGWGDLDTQDANSRGVLKQLYDLLNDDISENQQTSKIIPSNTLNNSDFTQSPYFTMEGALMPAPQMSELEKLMQLSRQQAGR